MVGPISRGEHRVSWASRTDSPPQRRSISQSQSQGPGASSSSLPTHNDPLSSSAAFFSPSEQREVDQSPLPVSPPQDTPIQEYIGREILSAPQASLDVRKLKPAARALMAKTQNSDEDFELDPNAPIRVAEERSASAAAKLGAGTGRRASRERGESSLDPVAEEDEKRDPKEDEQVVESKGKGKGRGVDGGGERGGPAGGQGGQMADGPVWGESFKVEWVRTHRLPFHRTRYLRNPWNHDREVKVSRDGTELEPSVGQALLEEWDKPDPAQQPGGSPPSDQRPAGAGTKS